MVKKLYKHEFAAWLRVIVFFWAATLLTAGINRIVQIFENDSIIYKILLVSGFLMYFISLFVTLAAPTIFGIVRFYKNFFTGEGYLTFTLPATKKQLLFVKISTAVCMGAASFLVCLLSGVIIMAGEVLTEVWKAAAYLMKDIPVDDALHLALFILEFLLLMLVADATNHFFYYTCISIGQTFRKNRILAAVGVYFVFYILAQVVSTVATITFTILGELGVLDTMIENLGKLVEAHPLACLHSGMWIGIALTFVGVLIDWAICHWVINKKLNLE